MHGYHGSQSEPVEICRDGEKCDYPVDASDSFALMSVVFTLVSRRRIYLSGLGRSIRHESSDLVKPTAYSAIASEIEGIAARPWAASSEPCVNGFVPAQEVRACPPEAGAILPLRSR